MARLLAVVLFLAAFAASAQSFYDKRKAEELTARREHRQAVEQFYQQCLGQLLITRREQCLRLTDKFSEDRLASLRQTGKHIPMTFNF